MLTSQRKSYYYQISKFITFKPYTVTYFELYIIGCYLFYLNATIYVLSEILNLLADPFKKV